MLLQKLFEMGRYTIPERHSAPEFCTGTYIYIYIYTISIILFNFSDGISLFFYFAY
jgi:hypothetical protein